LCAMPPDTPMGLDTYRWLAGDVLERRFEVRNGALAFEELDACAATLNLKKLETVFDAGD
ncbi:MAG: o-succinylbenzoate synthase, partial [Candidatus Hydrogenedentes bacterium]|nr:o-succinylbenzoate synthase [Candidatus Hydrogenedentota bacterium]